MKILLVEDDAISREVAAGAIRNVGHEPVLAGNGDEAWKILEGGSIRLVVSDWRMPGMDGLDLCRRVRGRVGPYVYFILLTAVAPDEANMEDAFNAGVDDFLTKPVKARELKRHLHVARRILEFAHRVEQLETILPICSYCKKVRTNEQKWAPVENFIQSQFGPKASHGICPDCFDQRVVPDLRASGIGESAIAQMRAQSAALRQPGAG